MIIMKKGLGLSALILLIITIILLIIRFLFKIVSINISRTLSFDINSGIFYFAILTLIIGIFYTYSPKKKYGM